MTDKGYQNRRETLDTALTANGCTKDNLKLIILTHGDNDHCANAAYFSKKYEAPIALHEKDVPLVTNLTLDTFLTSIRTY